MLDAMDAIVNNISEKIWELTETYTIQKDEERVTICYLMDELGSRIKHSEEPNVKLAPFFHIQKQFAVNLMWPVVDEIPPETVITRDVTFGETSCQKRAARLSILPESDDFDRSLLRMDECDKINPYKMYGRIEQTLPECLPSEDEHPVNKMILSASPSNPIKVATDMDFMAECVTDPMFKIISDEAEADIVFTSHHFDQYRDWFENNPGKVINQFPSENIICCKDLLIKLGRRWTLPTSDLENCDHVIRTLLNSVDENWAEKLHPDWMPISFDLVNELPVFVRHFLERQEKNLDNTWIIKPWNMARGRFIYVTDNLAMIVKLAYTFPKIIQKYIERPILFYRGDVGKVKFDIRYVVLLKSVSPLILYKYDVFWLRFANKPFSLTDFDVYEKHFTVMNYKEDAELKQIDCEDFKIMFEQQYPQFKWSEVDIRSSKMITEVFKSAVSLPPPRGLGHSPQARAIYAIDFMLKWSDNMDDFIPQILEVNFNADNRRACKYHPDFYNHCLNALLFSNLDDIPVTDISS